MEIILWNLKCEKKPKNEKLESKNIKLNKIKIKNVTFVFS